MREVKDGAARRLVDAVVLHADETVLHDVEDADAVRAAERVELFDDGGDLHFLAVDRHGHARLKFHGDLRGLVGCLIGRHAHFEEERLIEVRLERGVLKIKPLVAEVPEVLILGVVRLAADLQRDLVRLGVVDLLVTGLDRPLAPRRNDGHIGREALDGHFKTHLIVSLVGAAVSNGVRALRLGDLGIVVVLLQPRNDDRGIQTAGIGENDFFDGFLFHIGFSFWKNIYSMRVIIHISPEKPSVK